MDGVTTNLEDPRKGLLSNNYGTKEVQMSQNIVILFDLLLEV